MLVEAFRMKTLDLDISLFWFAKKMGSVPCLIIPPLFAPELILFFVFVKENNNKRSTLKMDGLEFTSTYLYESTYETPIFIRRVVRRITLVLWKYKTTGI
jgi:hypothetical protein